MLLRFIRFIFNGYKTGFKRILDEEEDFKTSYGALWSELMFLYKNEQSSAEMLLNPIRRIIEIPFAIVV